MIHRFLVRVGIEHFAFGLVLPVSIIWKLQSGLSISEVAFTESIILIATVLSEIPAGYFADRFSNRTSLAVGSSSHFIALLMTLYASDLFMFTMAALFFGIGWAFISGADEAHIHDDYARGKEGFQRNVSSMYITDEMGTVVGMVTGSLIVTYQGGDLGPVFIASAAAMLFVSVYSFLLLPAQAHKNSERGGEQVAIFRLFIRNMRKHWVVFALLAVLYEYGRFLWQPRLESSGIDVASLGFYFAAFKLASIFGSYIASKSNFSRNQIMVFFALTLVSLLTLVTTNSLVMLIGLATLLFSENFLRIWQSVVLNRISGMKRASFLSSASLSRNMVGAGIIFLLGFPAQRSIGVAVILLVVIKIFAGMYLITRYNLASSSSN